MELYVEPIVGHLRHPNALGPCVEAENSVGVPQVPSDRRASQQ